MSQFASGARTRVPRFAEAAVERARLTVVPQRSLGRTQAARTPFAVVVIAMLVAGVIGLLTFNTNMQQASFKATALQNQATALGAEEQSLTMELDQLRQPQRLAVAAKKLGMVAPAQPAFVRLSDGRVLGTPAKATPEDSVRVNALPTAKPRSINPKPFVVHVPAPTVDDTTGGATGGTTSVTPKSTGVVSGTTGAASKAGTATDGRKKTQP
jgi:cell division protein FtsL